MFSVTYISTKLEIKRKYNKRRWSTMLSSSPERLYCCWGRVWLWRWVMKLYCKDRLWGQALRLGYEDGMWSHTVRLGGEDRLIDSPSAIFSKEMWVDIYWLHKCTRHAWVNLKEHLLWDSVVDFFVACQLPTSSHICGVWVANLPLITLSFQRSTTA